MLLDQIRNRTAFASKYKTHPEAAVIACFFNPQKNCYRTKAFDIFYDSIKHLNHLIVECVIGESTPQLPNNGHVLYVFDRDAGNKEFLLNKAVEKLPPQIKYVFWLDADVIFANLDWLIDGVRQLKSSKIIQPFEYCLRLDQDQTAPSFDLDSFLEAYPLTPQEAHGQVWRGFAANVACKLFLDSADRDLHGHVGFAWGARRSVLDAVSLYEHGLSGDEASHLIAHAAAGHANHPCFAKLLSPYNLGAILDWCELFFDETEGLIGYVPGNLYHIWHGPDTSNGYSCEALDVNSPREDCEVGDSALDELIEKYHGGRGSVSVTHLDLSRSFDLCSILVAEGQAYTVRQVEPVNNDRSDADS
jgi:hypothetical protein